MSFLSHTPVLFFIGIAIWACLLARRLAAAKRDRNSAELKTTLLTKEVQIASAELKRINQEKADLSSILSHELRTPLMAIQESLNLILEGILGAVEVEQYETLGIAKRNADRLARLIHHVLDFETLKSETMRLNMEETDMPALVSEIHDLMRASIEKKKLKFVLQAPKKNVFAVCDPDMIRQLLINLLDNARKFTEAGGSVTLSLAEEQDSVRLSVCDTGIGIKPEDQSRIFDRYAQVTYKGPLHQGGAGVGLTVCRRIVERHHGEIHLQSAPGAGSSFTAVLPKGLALPLKPEIIRVRKTG